MKKIMTLIIIMIIPLILVACSGVSGDTSDKIISPRNNSIAIKGTWKVDKYKVIEKNENTESLINKYMNNTAQFDTKFSFISNEVCKNPQYKIKKVNGSYYILYQYKVDIKDLDIQENEEVEVISITSEDKHFYDFIRYKDDKMIIYIEGVFFYLTKTSDSTDQVNFSKSNIENRRGHKISSNDLSKCGVLLGLRSQREVDESGVLQPAKYRTLWISANGKKLYPLVDKEGLLLPRISGFWEVSVDRKNYNGYIRENIEVNPYGNPNKKQVTEDLTEKKESIFRNITFIGNDYIATEYFESSDLNINIFNKFQVLPVDNVGNKAGIKISDVAGESGKKALINSANSILYAKNKDVLDRLESRPREESFNVIRRNGHWIMRGRINAENEEDMANFIDYNINLLPPKKMINYDELNVPWNTIKSKIPEAVDGYIAPNNNIAIILTKNYIYIYGVNDKVLTDRPLKRIKLKDEESIVMAEWAMGDYVDKWDKIIKNEDKK